ncbi:probable calcium-binding protein CML35 [Malania oleifera]|uniref:probable calcium-binding protein CML35 n=1 Tax=Malania oleifera TaxID=397392 RepID=UPI0025AE4103|nr:probable calcium-binding protein CML35 [Malania oleifera]
MRIFQISPKRLFKSRKCRSVSRSDPPSFGSGSSSSSLSGSSDVSSSLVLKPAASAGTPKSVLPFGASGEWRDMSPGISAEFQYELMQAFKLIDKDGDGVVTSDELSALLRGVAAEDPPSEAELRTMLSEVDRNGDGCISLDELGAIGSVFGPARGSELRDAFDIFDRDHDGRITAEELLLVFQAIGDEGCTMDDCQRMIAGVNKNGDGFVRFEDFSRMMEQQQR